MGLFKIRNGLLEFDNYYMTTNFNDLLGYGATHSDIDSVYIDTNNEVSRRIDYPHCMIEIERDIWVEGVDGDEFVFFIGNTHERFGIKDYFQEEQHRYMRIVYLDKFVNCYVSDDKINWENVGGLDIADVIIDTQGFKKQSNNSLHLLNYGVYHDPFLTVQNFPQDYKIQLYNTTDTLLKERLFNNNKEAGVFLDSPLENAYIKILDTSDNVVFTSDRMNFMYGDIFAMIDYELEAIYQTRVLPNEEITPFDLDSYPDIITLKNISTIETYHGLIVGTVIDSNDIIQLSLDNSIFTNTVALPDLPPNETVDVYVQITRDESSDTFTSRNFLLKVF